MTPEHALDRTARLINMDLFAGKAPAEQIINGLLGTTVRLSADAANLSSANGQTALCALFGQIAMMGIGIDLDIPEVPLLIPQPPLTGDELRAALLGYARDLIPGMRCGSGLGDVDLSFVLGDGAAEGINVLRVTGTDWSCAVGPAGEIPATRWEGDWPIGALLAAMAGAAEALRAALQRMATATGYELNAEFDCQPGRPVRLDLSDRALPRGPLYLGRVDVVSGGAITNATIYALLRLPELSARLRVVEPETIDMTNLNRYPLARRSDVDRPKVKVLEGYSRGAVMISGVEARFDDSWAAVLGSLAPRVLVGADQIPVRWAVQEAAPQWLQATGTSHFFVMASSHQPDGPCAGCAHPVDEHGDDPIPTISFVSMWAGILQLIALLNEAADQPTAGQYTLCYPFGLAGPRPMIRGKMNGVATCPVGCEASRLATLLVFGRGGVACRQQDGAQDPPLPVRRGGVGHVWLEQADESPDQFV